MLVDPTAEDPWEYLDFDPITGNIVAKYDLTASDWSAKGVATVSLLQLDSREAIATGYRRTFLHLSGVVKNFLREGSGDTRILIESLRSADDHGLLEWCLADSGQNLAPFSTLRDDHKGVWGSCIAVIKDLGSSEVGANAGR